ncbi:MAG: nitronate monooxygenase [bacterium]
MNTKIKITTKISKLFNIQYPIIQGGMVWVSGWKLACAVSNCGGLGLIGAGSMKPELLKEHIIKCKHNTKLPFGVNIPLLRPDCGELIDAAIKENVKIFFTSAGHPGKYLEQLKKANAIVVHVVSNLKQAQKVESAGCDAVVCEGVEAGGHNGADELTSFCLIPQLRNNIKIPIIAAGGITDGNGIFAALALGADGVQIGTRFAVTVQSSASEEYKQKIIEAQGVDTSLIFRKIGLIRTLKNNFTNQVKDAENRGADIDELKTLLASKRERSGIFDGDFENGLMEAGQGVGNINQLLSVEELFEKFINEYNQIKTQLLNI